MNHVRVWLVTSALESVEGRVWTAHATITSRGCQHFPLLSVLWLVGDSFAVSLRCVWTRDRMMSVLFFCCVILPILSSHGCYMCTHGHPRISGHRPLKTSSHLAIHIPVSPILTCFCCGKPSEVVPSFPFGSGASWLLTAGHYSGRRR